MASKLLKVIDEASAWLDINGVEGVAQGSKDGQDCIVVGFSCQRSEISEQIPATFKGYPVVFENWGIVSAQDPE